MPTAELTRRDGVELARSGSWALSTGRWTATPDDFAAAIAATTCPAIRRPYLRVGHTDERFGDGEPAIGWIENLRLSDGGNTLVGDWVEIPDWLNTVAASAYPDRSIEGAYNRQCALGHCHPFVLDGLALLGVTRPGVGTLKPIGGLADVKNLFAPLPVAASGEVRIAASIPGAAIAAAAEEHTGAMIALIPTDEDTQRIAVEGGEPADQLHCTLMYLGDAADLDSRTRQDILDNLTTAANGLPLVEAEGFALSVFNPPGSTRDDGKQRDSCITLGLSGDLLDAVHAVVAESVRYASPKQHAPWHAHLTLTYTDDLSQLAALADRTGPVRFDRLRVAFAGERFDVPLIGEDDSDVGDDPDEPSGGYVAAAEGGDRNSLKNYFTKDPRGLKRWRGKKHPWTALFRILRRHLDPERAKRTASAWYREVFGHMPNQKRKVNASEVAVPNPQPSLADRVREAWNASGAPFSQHVHQVRAGTAIVLDEADRSFWRVPVTVDGDAVTFGAKERVMPDFVDYDEQTIAASVVFASREESRPTATVLDSPSPIEQQPPNPILPAEPAPPATPPDEPPPTEEPPTPPPPGGVPVSPGAEPGPSEPEKGVGPVSTLSTDVRSRLGLAEDADDAAVVAALDALKSKADTPPAPTPEQVAASAASEQEKDELRKEVKVLASRMEQVTAELAATKAEKAATVKASVLDGAQKQGKFTPAEREQWSKDYDDAPGPVTRILASIAPGTAVPVAAAGYTGTGEEQAESFDDAEYQRLFGEKAGA